MDEILLKTIAIYNLGFFIFHIYFWKLFKWEKELKKMSIANSAILQIANVQLLLYFFCMACIFLWFPLENFQTTMGLVILGIAFSFWIVRLVSQFIFLRVSSGLVYSLTLIFVFGVLLHGFLFARIFEK